MQQIIIAILLFLTLSCGEETDRAEVLDRVRALGIDWGTSSADFAQTLQVTVFASVPKGKKATITGYVPPSQGKFYSIAADKIQMLADGAVYEAHNGFDLLSFKAAVTLPTKADMGFLKKARFGFSINVDGDDEIVVDEVALSDKQKASTAAVVPVTVNIVTLQAPVKAKAEVDIQSSFTNPNSESVRLGWFVSNGKITNRRSAKTQWTAPDAGAHSLVFTARGLQSKSFALKISDITVE